MCMCWLGFDGWVGLCEFGGKQACSIAKAIVDIGIVYVLCSSWSWRSLRAFEEMLAMKLAHLRERLLLGVREVEEPCASKCLQTFLRIRVN